MQDILKLVGSRIRDYRKSKGLSQDQLGEMCGFHFSYIGGVERGERNLSLENIGKIAVALDVEPKLLFEFDEPFILPVAEEKEAALHEVLAILKGKEVSQIRMSRNILAEIFNTLPYK
ncbi:helix-turn-helix transcriptional regulator [Paenibacillus validus]|uniref:helix-turn-helix domain-containing protein n=1 Tax=Paenibacillus validus TaxID=44253 RepID=UPI000FD95865|nr:helix-turn-helix transcriptional regulator [Paenibacillus validus]MED4600690.1 helix-turn-helix transcriptional regulator [Paenibacillus validus]MED4605329.1 helix-turn-helix transcriptional regulator [Paenibacillus validus]